MNVSINRIDAPPGSGTRCEIKNLNSVKFIIAAISVFTFPIQILAPILLFVYVAHEIHRQSALLASSAEARVEQETRGFDETTFQTFRLRSKEDAPDYRYMPDPNLGVLRISKVSRHPPFQIIF